MKYCSFSLFIFSALVFLSFVRSTRAASCHPDDEAGLLAFKSGITQDPTSIFSSWKKGTNCCSWKGVTCTAGDRVTLLEVYGRSDAGEAFLDGSISPSLAKLKHLNEVHMTDLGNISGSFPPFLLQLPKLKYIYIQNNRLSGPLPTNIGVLSQLEHLDLEGNRFTGSIPSSISNLTRLSRLNLGGNRFYGTIPDIFKPMTDLQYLNLSRNRFFGKLPPSVASLAPTLWALVVGQNKLSGTIPDYLSSFEHLSLLDLSRNRFSGVVPKSFANLTRLYDLNLSHNLLTGPFPTLDVRGMESLDLSYNKFHMKTIPKWVTLLPIIYSLKLAKCGIIMSLDDWNPVAPLSYDSIDLSENEISGSPEWLLNQTTFMLEFRASGNKLGFDLGKLTFSKRMITLDLSRNLIFGKVPAMVAGLQKLNLSQNHLCGKLPSTHFQANAFAGNNCLCGAPLSPCKS
ncbi:Leucine-rich repeat (LRR) family protein [Raphanus sativus]|uniref:Leucine-rich repeat receptor-like protein kinase PXC2 n=1 Tax=Raphanus sativus TaxID=3726 RepID=A0A6J0M015_RAPSA|nr:leucine-rich repeat receptor-like protein kinase PXC2 [Raphanus sativus]KAJ4895021.1 Leucine-rich repeat (LRR) family protein [Raphanus sativus]